MGMTTLKYLLNVSDINREKKLYKKKLKSLINVKDINETLYIYISL